MSVKKNTIRVSLVAVFVGLIGCGQAPAPQSTGVSPKNATAGSSGHANTEESGLHEHSTWWCGEHGVPEEECGLCNAKLAAQLQKKGDWCKEHDRPDSQCFVCHPEKEAQFSARYEAKYGKKPPRPEGS